MEPDSSLSHSIDGAKKHYSSLFFLPSLKRAILYIAILCLVVGLTAWIVEPSQGLIGGLTLGVFLFVLTLIADFAMSKLVLNRDPIFVLRRTLVLSVFSWAFWLLFIVIGVALSPFLGWIVWVKLSLLGFAAIITLRVIVFIATSPAATWRRAVSVLLQPLLCLVAFLLFWTRASNNIPSRILPFIFLAPLVALITGILFFYPVQSLGEKKYSLPSIALFKAFIINWVTDNNAPIEKILEDIGEDKAIDVNLLKFDSETTRAAIIVPLVHPGPFKNVGSSLLPSLLKKGFEEEFGCEACTPLGILGHELDLASQAQNHKVVSKILASARIKGEGNLASPFVRVTEGAAAASCQIFGDAAFLSFTLAPGTTEDLPQELGRIVEDEAGKYGLKQAIVVNTHNSITDVIDTDEHFEECRVAAAKCLKKTVAAATGKFLVGAASVFPKEFSLKSGMGTGGITATVVQVDKQKTAYIVIDGNNMISGLREKILASLSLAGFDESEVFTTDTHAVSAVITGQRGYHPVGEVMNHDLLIRYIIDVAKEAQANLEVCNVACLHLVVPGVRVIGEARLKSLTTFVDDAIKTIKRSLLPVFGLEGIVLILLLLFL